MSPLPSAKSANRNLGAAEEDRNQRTNDKALLMEGMRRGLNHRSNFPTRTAVLLEKENSHRLATMTGKNSINPRPPIWLNEIPVLNGANISGKLLTGRCENLPSGLTCIDNLLGWTVKRKTDKWDSKDLHGEIIPYTHLPNVPVDPDLRSTTPFDLLPRRRFSVDHSTVNGRVLKTSFWGNVRSVSFWSNIQSSTEYSSRNFIRTSKIFEESFHMDNSLVSFNHIEETEESFHMDNSLVSFNHIEETEEFIHEAKKSLTTAHFNFRCWQSKMNTTDFQSRGCSFE
ncbi:hypothetical protein NPIL_523021 [Nephila pilipes]|uniref:Uncharacterized protein n=1 Tax=Nephila pilipes TaxID=299642 RepID=A0A8X6QU27_NEPPI|nr:hypothetical protein NPIL_523021 [Nephila pilipes]